MHWLLVHAFSISKNSFLLTCNLNLFNIRQALTPFIAETVPGEVYAVLFAQIRDVLLRLGGPPIRIKIARIEQELISLEMQSHYIQVLQYHILILIQRSYFNWTVRLQKTLYFFIDIWLILN